MTTPRTEAGRQYLDAHRADLHSPGDLPDGPCWCLDSILAIEQEAGRLAVSEALSVERIAAALFKMHAGPFSVEDRRGRPIWEGFGWSRGMTPPTDPIWGPKLRAEFAAALRAALLASPVAPEGNQTAERRNVNDILTSEVPE